MASGYVRTRARRAYRNDKRGRKRGRAKRIESRDKLNREKRRGLERSGSRSGLRARPSLLEEAADERLLPGKYMEQSSSKFKFTPRQVSFANYFDRL
jgi:hypothetical protein